MAKKVFVNNKWVTTTKATPREKYKVLFRQDGVTYYLPKKKKD